jgi:hypothetical protein
MVDHPESPDDELFDVWDEAAHADELAISFILGVIPLDEISAAEFLATLRSLHPAVVRFLLALPDFFLRALIKFTFGFTELFAREAVVQSASERWCSQFIETNADVEFPQLRTFSGVVVQLPNRGWLGRR